MSAIRRIGLARLAPGAHSSDVRHKQQERPLNPVSDTAFYTCGIRTQDAESAHPVLNDKFAPAFMNERGKEVFAAFKNDKIGNTAHLARHGTIDQLVRARVQADPDTHVIMVGAGFDSRAYRIQGGRWFELDEPAVIAYKNERLAIADCPNSLTRIAVDFSAGQLGNLLPRVAEDAKVVVVIEGVFFYLSEMEIDATLYALRAAYPRHVLICDLMTRQFIEKRNKKINKNLQQLNAPFKFFSDSPSSVFVRTGYRIASETSIITRTLELMMGRIGSLIAWLKPKTVSGYMLYTFEIMPTTLD
jgi:methyltransferase (TIGR00027 family)